MKNPWLAARLNMIPLGIGYGKLTRHFGHMSIPRFAGTALFILTVILFLIPWQTVHYPGAGHPRFGTAARLSGIDLVVGRDFEWDGDSTINRGLAELPPCPEDVVFHYGHAQSDPYPPPGGKKRAGLETLGACDQYKEVLRPNTFAAIALALSFAGISLLFVSGKNGRILRATLGTMATVAIILALTEAYHYGHVQVHSNWSFGYWLALLSVLGAAGVQLFARNPWFPVKNPWLAALLNILPLPVGLGYLYLDANDQFLRAVLGAFAAAGIAVLLMIPIAIWAVASCLMGCYHEVFIGLLWWTIPPIPVLIHVFRSALNGWRLAADTTQT